MSFIITGLNVLGFAIPIVFDILLLFDSLIYSIAAYLLQAFFEIASFNINSNSINGTKVVEAIMYRVMVLGGVYALFRLGISLITYITNPTEADNASKNGSKIVKNTVIAILLLAASKFIFNFLYDFSTSIITNGTIQQIIYGPEAEYPDYSEEQTAKSFVNGVFLILFQKGDDTALTSDAAKAAVSHVVSGEASILTLADYAYSSSFHYIPILTTVVGVMLIYYFGSFAIELGVRLFKLFILQVISPIPIILSIDPKQNKKLSNFAKAYSGIYISLFIRIITVYMAFVLLNLIEGIFGQLGKLTDTTTTGFISLDATFLVEILLIIACFQAAKELPKLIEEALGTKLGLGDAGKGFKAALMGSVGGTLGLMTGAVAGGISGGPGGIVAGGFSGAWNGATKGAAAKNAVGLAGTVVGNTKGALATGARVAGAGGLGAFMLGGVENFFGGKGRDEATIAKFEGDIKEKDKLIAATEKKLENSNRANELRNNIENTLGNGFVSEHGSLNEFMSRDAELSKLQEAVRINNDNLFYNDNPEYRQIDIDRVENRKKELAETYNLERDSYIKEKMDTFSAVDSVPTSNFDQNLKDLISDYNEFVDKNGYTDRKITSYDSYNNSKSKAESDNREYQREIAKYEKEKKAIEERKKEFIESDPHRRRSQRDEKYKHPPRKTNNN